MRKQVLVWVAAIAALTILSESAFAINIYAKTLVTPTLAVYDGKLRLIFAGHNNPYLWEAVYNPTRPAGRRWTSLGRIYDENVRRSWAMSYHTPVAIGVERRGMLTITTQLELVFNGHNNSHVWRTVKRPAANPAFHHWDTPRSIPGTAFPSPIGATIHRWRGDAKLTVGYERGGNIYYRVLESERPTEWGEEHEVPVGPTELFGTGVTVHSSTHDGRDSEYPSFFVFYTRGEDILPGRRVWYTRPERNQPGVADWDTPRSLTAEAPPVHGWNSSHGDVINSPGPIAVVGHPRRGMVVAYAARDDEDLRNTGRIWMGSSTDASAWAALGFVQNIVESYGNPALVMHGDIMYMAFLPVQGPFIGTASEEARVRYEICVGIVDLEASGGPRFRSIRTDLPNRYCVEE